MDDGVYPGLTRAAYDSIDAINQSTLKKFRRSAAHARHEMLNPRPPSAEMQLGTALHCLVLEPDDFNRRYAVSPKFDRRKTKDKEAAAAFESDVAKHGKSVIDEVTHAKVFAMRNALMGHTIASELLVACQGTNECGVVWTDAEYSVKCKALMDRIAFYGGETFVVDLKTTSNADAGPFANDAAKYGYHMQAAFYLDGLNASSWRSDRQFVFVAVESEPPYGVAVYRLDHDSINAGRMAIRRYLQMYAECRAINVWPGYDMDINHLNLPKWALEEI